MNDLSVIDRFLDVFSRYIDSGFGLLGGEVGFLTATLVAIDMTLAGLFWAMGNASGGGGDDVIGKLIKKVLYVGAFAFILNNFNSLSGIVFRSFAGLGLVASGSSMTQGQLLQPGRLARVGVEAGAPIMRQISELTGFPEVFGNLDVITVLFLAWLVLIVSFFVLAVQLFVTLIEFKLTTLAGFVLVPFALWNKTAFLAERVLGNVVSSGIKVLVLAVIVGIGTGLFAEFTVPPATEPSIDHALVIMLAALAMLGLGFSGPALRPVWCLAHLNLEQVRRPGLRWVPLAWPWQAVLLWQVRVLRWPLGPGWRRVLRERLLAAARAPRGLRRPWPAGRNPPTRPAPPHRALVECARPVRASPTSRAAAPVR